MFTVLTCCSSFGSLTDFRETADGGTVPERDILLALSVFTDTCCRKPWITVSVLCIRKFICQILLPSLFIFTLKDAKAKYISLRKRSH